MFEHGFRVCVCVCVVSIRKYKMPSFNFISENVGMRRLNSGANRAHEFCSSCFSWCVVVLIQFNNILIFATNHNSTQCARNLSQHHTNGKCEALNEFVFAKLYSSYFMCSEHFAHFKTMNKRGINIFCSHWAQHIASIWRNKILTNCLQIEHLMSNKKTE